MFLFGVVRDAIDINIDIVILVLVRLNFLFASIFMIVLG